MGVRCSFDRHWKATTGALSDFRSIKSDAEVFFCFWGRTWPSSHRLVKISFTQKWKSYDREYSLGLHHKSVTRYLGSVEHRTIWQKSLSFQRFGILCETLLETGFRTTLQVSLLLQDNPLDGGTIIMTSSPMSREQPRAIVTTYSVVVFHNGVWKWFGRVCVRMVKSDLRNRKTLRRRTLWIWNPTMLSQRLSNDGRMSI